VQTIAKQKQQPKTLTRFAIGQRLSSAAAWLIFTSPSEEVGRRNIWDDEIVPTPVHVLHLQQQDVELLFQFKGDAPSVAPVLHELHDAVILQQQVGGESIRLAFRLVGNVHEHWLSNGRIHGQGPVKLVMTQLMGADKPLQPARQPGVDDDEPLAVDDGVHALQTLESVMERDIDAQAPSYLKQIPAVEAPHKPLGSALDVVVYGRSPQSPIWRCSLISKDSAYCFLKQLTAMPQAAEVIPIAFRAG
jgi:hypothetical protein